MSAPLPPPLAPFLRFAAVLRAHRFPVSPDQTAGFIEAVGALGPRSIHDVRAAGLALFAIGPERMAEFDALFRDVFLDQTISAEAEGGEGEEDVKALEPGGEIIAEEDGEEEAGGEATAAERLSRREPAMRGGDAMSEFSRLAPAKLPRRTSYRHRRAKKGAQPDMRRAIAAAAKRDGEIILLPRRRRKMRQRRIALLLDISASMRAQTDEALSFAHLLLQRAERAEVFTLGTRLTRITPALAPQSRAEALARAGRSFPILTAARELARRWTLSFPCRAGPALRAARWSPWSLTGWSGGTRRR